MTQLPTLLQPWAAWLALFPEEQAAPLGRLLLRLNPLVGPLRRHASAQAIEPAGIGDIVRRGSYERLLISQWAYADSAPDEFLRRAANGELLFTGPEPAHAEQALRSIALFDAGPLQLGEPRLAHMAMFILLARRAELAGAAFAWGILQRPGVLYETTGAYGVHALLKARTYAVPDAACLAQWDDVLGTAPADCWLIGDPDSPRPPPVRAHVAVRRSWLADELEIVVTQRHQRRTAALPLPPPDACVRLLRRPFDAPAGPGTMQWAAGTHTLKRPPLFGNRPEWLAVGMVDGGTTVYRIPAFPRAPAGRARHIARPAHADSIVAAGLCQKAFGTVVRHDDALHFSGFPGPFFKQAGKDAPAEPVPANFQATPGARRWLPAFYTMQREGNVVIENVFVLDKAGRLGCWTRSGMAHDAPARSAFRVVAENVIGAVQHGDKLLFAAVDGNRTDAYALHGGASKPAHLYPLMHAGSQFLFGDLKNWRGGHGMYALRLDDARWLVGDSAGADHVAVEDGWHALGCARAERKARPSLVLIDPGRCRIVLQTGAERSVLAESVEPIAQACFDPVHDRLAWLGQKSGMLTVLGIGVAEPYLHTVPREGLHG